MNDQAPRRNICPPSSRLRPVWSGPDQLACDVNLLRFLLGIPRLVRFDRPPRHLLGSMDLASSARGSASALRDGFPGAAVGSSVPAIASTTHLALTIAAVGEGGLTLAGGLQTRLGVSASPPALGDDGQRYAGRARGDPVPCCPIARSRRQRSRRSSRPVGPGGRLICPAITAHLDPNSRRRHLNGGRIVAAVTADEQPPP